MAAKRETVEERKRRRRQWYYAARVPDALVGAFTLGELAAVGAAIDTIKHANGPCALRPTDIADRAGVSTTTYNAAMRKARDLGLLQRLPRQGPAHRPSLYEMPRGG